jgi:NADH-quinone oxidoreductase subunit M
MRDTLLALQAGAWLLPAMIVWPAATAGLVRALGRDPGTAESPAGWRDARALTVAALTVEALLGAALWVLFDPALAGWQARVDLPWIPELGAAISLGVDGLSLPLVVMSVTVLPLLLLGAWNNVRTRTPAFGALLLLLTSGVVGALVALDLLAFYVAWELILVPMYFLVGVWALAGESRVALRYVLFTLVGSLLMLVAILALWSAGGGTSFHLDHLLAVPLPPRTQLWLFGAFFAAFAVKSALVPFHSWFPPAQAAAPTVVAVVLGFKVGGYALLRFAIPLFPAAALHPTVRIVILGLAVVTVLYGALLAMAQGELRRVVAYSSISHLGFIMLGGFALTPEAVSGAVLSMVHSGLASAVLLLAAGVLDDRTGTTELGAFGGLASAAPLLSIALVLGMLSTVALPGTLGFVGEFLVLMGSYAQAPALTLTATVGVVLAAVYGLRPLQQLLFGARSTLVAHGVPDLTRRESGVLAALVVALLWLGVAPAPVLDRMQGAVRQVVEGARFGPNARPAIPTVSETP